MTNIQGEFKLQRFVGYLGYMDPKRDKRKIRGIVTQETIDAWGLDYNLDYVMYLRKANNISYGTFYGLDFVVDKAETTRVRSEIVRCAPTIFLDRSNFYLKDKRSLTLSYSILEKLPKKKRKFDKNDYIVGTGEACRFMNTFLGTELEKDSFVQLIKEGKIIFYQKAPTKEHQKNRKHEVKEAMLSGDWSDLRLFRLCDLVLLAQ